MDRALPDLLCNGSHLLAVIASWRAIVQLKNALNRRLGGKPADNGPNEVIYVQQAEAHCGRADHREYAAAGDSEEGAHLLIARTVNGGRTKYCVWQNGGAFQYDSLGSTLAACIPGKFRFPRSERGYQ